MLERANVSKPVNLLAVHKVVKSEETAVSETLRISRIGGKEGVNFTN